jgi:pimeloyl-ACP methyl ester carboxylesterase
VSGDITFLDTTALAGIGATLSASAIVFHTTTDVFLIYRGLAGAAAALGTMKTTPGNITLLGQTVAVHGGFLDSWRLVASDARSAVQSHLALTSSPSTARVFLAGHSMGGVHALLSAMQLLEARVPLGGVYLYGLPKPGRQNFVNLFSSRPDLSSITYVWWNEVGGVVVMMANPPSCGMGTRTVNWRVMLPPSLLCLLPAFTTHTHVQPSRGPERTP